VDAVDPLALASVLDAARLGGACDAELRACFSRLLKRCRRMLRVLMGCDQPV
jgi:hypothetical protein